MRGLVIAIAAFLVALSFPMVAQTDVPLLKNENLIYRGISATCSDGSLVVLWEDSKAGDLDILAQKIDPSGNLIWLEPIVICRKPGLQNSPQIVRTSEGKFFICWFDYKETYISIDMQLMTEAGQLLWDTEGVPLEGVALSKQELQILPNEDGGAFLFYTVIGESNQTVKMQKVNQSANHLFPVGGIQLYSANQSLSIQTALSDNESGAIVNIVQGFTGTNYAWSSHPIRVNAYGTIVGNDPWLTSMAFGASGFHVYPGLAGEFIVTRTSTSGNPVQRIMKVNSQGVIVTPAVNYAYPALYGTEVVPVKALSDGSLVLSWLELTRWTEGFWRFQRFNADLSPSGAAVSISVWGNFLHTQVMEADDQNLIIALVNLVEVPGQPSLRIYKLSPQGQMLWGNGGVEVSNHIARFVQKFFISDLTAQVPATLVWVQFENIEHYTLNYQKINSSGSLLIDPSETVLQAWDFSSYDNAGLVKVGQNYLVLSEYKSYYSIFNQNLNPLTVNNYFSEQANPYYYVVDYAVNDQDKTGVALSGYADSVRQFWWQEINPDGSLGYFEPLFLCPDIGYSNFLKVWTEGSAFYVVWTDLQNVVKGQKIVDGVFQWGDSGRVIMSSGTLTTAKRSYILCKRSGGYRLLRIDENGDPAPGWSGEGVSVFGNNLIATDPPYPFIQFLGDDVIIVSSGEYLSSRMQRISPSGQVLWAPEGVVIPTSHPTFTSWVKDIYCDDAIHLIYLRDFHYASFETLVGEVVYVRYDGNGNPIDGSLRVLDNYINCYGNEARIIAFPDGWKKLIWNNTPPPNRYPDLFMVNLSPAGEASEKQVLCNAPNSQKKIYITNNGLQNVITWQDERANFETLEGGTRSVYGAVLSSGASNLDDQSQVQIPLSSSLSSFPNPFRESTKLSFNLLSDEVISLSVYNLKGQKVRDLLSSQSCKAGENHLTWDGRDNRGITVTSGVYIYKLSDKKQTRIAKLLMLK